MPSYIGNDILRDVRLGDQLRRSRLAVGLSQLQLAAAAGTSQPTVAAYEAGRVVPNADTLERLLKACDHVIEIVPTSHPVRWTRVEERSLAIHRLVAARLLDDPVATLRKARKNLDTMRRVDSGHSDRWFDEWDDVLQRPVDVIVTTMLARTQNGIDLRQVTPFAGVLSDAERRRALRSAKTVDAA